MVLAYSTVLTKQDKLLTEARKMGSIAQVDTFDIGEGLQLEAANSLAYRSQAGNKHERSRLDMWKYDVEERRRAAHIWEPGGPWKTSDALLRCRVSIQLQRTIALLYWKAAEESHFLKKLKFKIFRSILLIFNCKYLQPTQIFQKVQGPSPLGWNKVHLWGHVKPAGGYSC